MINLTAARLIWLLYTSDWVEEGAGSGLDLMWWVGSSWAASVERPCWPPSPGCSLAVLCPPPVAAPFLPQEPTGFLPHQQQWTCLILPYRAVSSSFAWLLFSRNP